MTASYTRAAMTQPPVAAQIMRGIYRLVILAEELSAFRFQIHLAEEWATGHCAAS